MVVPLPRRSSEIYLRIYFLIWEFRQQRKKLLCTFQSIVDYSEKTYTNYQIRHTYEIEVSLMIHETILAIIIYLPSAHCLSHHHPFCTSRNSASR